MARSPLRVAGAVTGVVGDVTGSVTGLIGIGGGSEPVAEEPLSISFAPGVPGLSTEARATMAPLVARLASDDDLIVIGAHKPDFKDYLLGPNAARVVRHSHCSVHVVR